MTFSPLLDLSRIAAGTLTLSFEEVDLKELVHSSVETLQAQAARKGIALSSSVEIPGEVDCKVWGDKIGLQQILANILSNALKFTPEGGAVTGQLRRTQGTAIVMVKDTGRGMSPDFPSPCFQRVCSRKIESQRKWRHGFRFGNLQTSGRAAQWFYKRRERGTRPR
jgi:signal transduction histidine kinase